MKKGKLTSYCLTGHLGVGQTRMGANEHVYIGWFDGSTRDLTGRSLDNLMSDLEQASYMVKGAEAARTAIQNMIQARRSVQEAAAKLALQPAPSEDKKE